MLFDVTTKVYRKGEKVVLCLAGLQVETEVLSTSVVDFERKYLVKYSDGVEQWLTARELNHALN